MRYTCTACEHGQHDLCAGRHAPPEGMMGGSECDCDGKCGERPPTAKQDELVKEMTDIMEARDDG